jgi:hypothetical protein
MLDLHHTEIIHTIAVDWIETITFKKHNLQLFGAPEHVTSPAVRLCVIMPRMMAIACYLVLARVPSIHDFDIITPLFSDHTPNTDVLENNSYTAEITNGRYTRQKPNNTQRSSFLGYPKYAGQLGNHTSHKL